MYIFLSFFSSRSLNYFANIITNV